MRSLPRLLLASVMVAAVVTASIALRADPRPPTAGAERTTVHSIERAAMPTRPDPIELVETVEVAERTVAGDHETFVSMAPVGGLFVLGDSAKVDPEGEHGITTVWEPMPSQLELHVEHDGRRLPTVTLDGFGAISGRVVSADGEAVVAAAISLRSADRSWDSAAVGDAGGRFHIDFIPADREIDVIAAARITADTTDRVVSTRAGEIVLSAGDER